MNDGNIGTTVLFKNIKSKIKNIENSSLVTEHNKYMEINSDPNEDRDLDISYDISPISCIPISNME